MNRRTYVATIVTTSLTALAGCLGWPTDPEGEQGDDGAGTIEPQTEPTARSPENVDDVALQIWNGRSTEQRVQVTITSEAETILDREVTVQGNDSKTLDTGIEEQGQYELRASLDDGSSESYPVSVDDYALRSGSDLIVEITDDRVDVMMEE